MWIGYEAKLSHFQSLIFDCFVIPVTTRPENEDKYESICACECRIQFTECMCACECRIQFTECMCACECRIQFTECMCACECRIQFTECMCMHVSVVYSLLSACVCM